MSEEDFSKFTRPRLDNEIHQGSEVPVTFGIDPSDGLPRPSIPDNQDRPPPLAVDTFVCMEDKRDFVIRNSDGSIWLSFQASEVSRLPSGEYFVETAAVGRKDSRFTSDEMVRSQLDEHLVQTNLPPPPGEVGLGMVPVGWVREVVHVEPIRPACQYYIRMQTDISADRERRYLTRSCQAQRSETGEYYSLGDSAIYACSLRSPRHLASEQVLDDFDAESMQQSLNRVKAGSFDVDAELAKELGVLGNP